MSKLEQRLEQKQVPQPRQILQATILQLNTVNLEERILEELETNPALDQIEGTSEPEVETADDEDLDWEQDNDYEPPNVYEKKRIHRYAHSPKERFCGIFSRPTELL